MGVQVTAEDFMPFMGMDMFDAIVSADAFVNLKPAPDIFLAASKTLDVLPSEVRSYQLHNS
ncbi:hypothetical protein Syun_028659 [Stephania yunnanensis]|uniref:Uncharacterized protein n=1 Tax=Stephania yunnanensis TaxID=152371 RepID=A0AAP0HKP7_9MAGN